jgi:pimeloyl-ACP methyl ester carboxylesterase
MPRVKVSDIEMHYDEVGSGPPLLISTGWARAERAFVQHRELLASRYRCIRHDHRGIGASDAPDAPYSIEMLADDLAGLLDALDIERCRVLGGGGMGALVGMELAIRHPDRVCALMLGSPCLKVDNFLRQIMAMWKDLRRLDPVLWAREVTFWCYTPDTFNQRPEITEGAARARGGEQTFPEPWAFDRLVDAYCDYDATPRAGSIKCPTLIANASEFDLITGPRFAVEVQRAIPGSKLHVFENTSHNFWVERFDDWWNLTRDFFEAHGDE